MPDAALNGIYEISEGSKPPEPDDDLDELMNALEVDRGADAPAGAAARPAVAPALLVAAPQQALISSPLCTPVATPKSEVAHAAAVFGTPGAVVSSPVLSARARGPSTAPPQLPAHLAGAWGLCRPHASPATSPPIMPLVPHLPPPPAALCGSPTAPALTPPARPRASDAGGLDGADDAPLVSRRAPPLALPPAAHGPAAPAARPCGRVRGVLFAAVFLTPASREVLLAVLPARHPLVRGDHMILALRPTKAQLLALPLGAEVPLRIIGQAADSRAQALAADPPAWLPPTAAGATHVALSLAPGVRGREAGALLIDALQRAAAGCGAEDAFGGAAPGEAAGSWDTFRTLARQPDMGE
jgi:hypothetical protein